MVKKKIAFFLLFSYALIPALVLPCLLTSCSVSSVQVQTYRFNALAVPGEHINFSCKFLGTNMQDFDWYLERGENFDYSYVDLSSHENCTTIVGNTMFVSIPLTNSIPGGNKCEFKCTGVFFNKKNNILTKTDEIVIKKDVESPILEDNFTISKDQMPVLTKPEYFESNSSKNPIEALAFLDVGKVKNEEEGTVTYNIDDIKRVREVIFSDFVAFIRFAMTNLKKVWISDTQAPMDLNFGKDNLTVSIKYDMDTKTFESVKVGISVDLIFLNNIIHIPASFSFEIQNYKVSGIREIKNEDNFYLYDCSRKVLGNFMMLSPSTENESFYKVKCDVNLIVDRMKFEHLCWFNNIVPFILSVADLNQEKTKYTGKDQGISVPCYNLDGKEFTEEYINNYTDASKTASIYNSLLVKGMEKIDIKELINPATSPIHFYLKDTLKRKLYRSIDCFSVSEIQTEEDKMFDEIGIFINLVSDEKNKWKNIKVLDDIDFGYYSYLSRIDFDLNNANNPICTITLNPIFSYQGSSQFTFSGSSYFSFVQ